MVTNLHTTRSAATPIGRRLVALVALVCFVAIAYSASPNAAQAASWNNNCYLNGFNSTICNPGTATLQVICTTIYRGNTKTWGVRAYLMYNGITEPLAIQWSIRAGNQGSAANYKSDPGWKLQPLNTADVFQDPWNTVPAATTPRWVQVKLQFALWMNGQWNYSPNGDFEYASHSESNGAAYTSTNGASCWLK